MGTVLTVPTPRGFSLGRAVCSYGYFVLAPNFWTPVRDPRRGVLHRPLRDERGRVVRTRIMPSRDGRRVLVRCGRRVARRHHARLRAQVRRMMRLDERLPGWAAVHPAAAHRRFGRLFRSPTLFEDIVKTITGCNITWPATVRMNKLLCERAGTAGDFPTPDELAGWTPSKLAARCRVGYRAERIVRLARDVADGRLDLDGFERPDRETDELYEALRQIHGVGDYAANNILQLLGRYDRLPVDTETVRHFRDLHRVDGDAGRIADAARRHYARFAPYQFLAYWHELWTDYERRYGPAWAWPAETHTSFTASRLRRDGRHP